MVTASLMQNMVQIRKKNTYFVIKLLWGELGKSSFGALGVESPPGGAILFVAFEFQLEVGPFRIPSTWNSHPLGLIRVGWGGVGWVGERVGGRVGRGPWVWGSGGGVLPQVVPIRGVCTVWSEHANERRAGRCERHISFLWLELVGRHLCACKIHGLKERGNVSDDLKRPRPKAWRILYFIC